MDNLRKGKKADSKPEVTKDQYYQLKELIKEYNEKSMDALSKFKYNHKANISISRTKSFLKKEKTFNMVNINLEVRKNDVKLFYEGFGELISKFESILGDQKD